MTPPLLRVQGLTKHFPVRAGFFRSSRQWVKAVQDVSFEVAPGETLSLVGESGCGKSTLGRTLMRLEEPTAGEVWFDGEDFAKLSSERLFQRRRDLQMIFQDPYSSLNPRLTVGDIVREPLRIHRLGTAAEQIERTRALLELVGLRGEMLDRFPHEFSGGQRQRIGIARALALRPKLVVADEPVSALDVSVQAQVINLMVRLQREYGLAYLFVSHDLSVVHYISDRVAIMYLGRIVEIGNRDGIFDSSAHPYTRALIASSPVPDPRRRRETEPIRGEIPSPLNPPSGCAFHPRCPLAQDRCRAELPVLRALPGLADGHRVACHRAEEVLQSAG